MINNSQTIKQGDTIKKYWNRVDVRDDDDCWPWLGLTIKKDGRGCMIANGRNETSGRLTLWVAGIDAPDGKTFACHSCDNPNCVNPAHLWWGSNQENIRDARSKNRLAAQKKTHCKNGHEFSDQNTRYNSRGARQCRTCQTGFRRAHAARARAAMRII